jgi:hypothetical protein
MANGRSKTLEGLIPAVEHGPHRVVILLSIAARRTLRPGRVSDMLVGDLHGLAGGRRTPRPEGTIGQAAERNNRVHLCPNQQGIEPAVAIRGNQGVVAVALATPLGRRRYRETY